MASTELSSVAKVSGANAVALFYCYCLVSRIPPGKRRLLALFPVFYLFTQLPFYFSGIHLRGISAFFLVWLGTFKLVLFSFDRGPLADPTLSLTQFVSVASFPVKIKQDKQAATKPSKIPIFAASTVLVYAVKGLLLALLIAQYPERHRYPRTLVICSYGVHLYLGLEIVLGLSALTARAFIGRSHELEPQFSVPYLSTSLQDFWSRRWNLMVTRILHPCVYIPVRSRLGPRAAVMAAFIVSGLMHEVIFYYTTLTAPTWELTCFFALHGVLVAVEVSAKYMLAKRAWRPIPTVVAAPLTIGLVLVTGLWLFFPPIVKSDAEEQAIGECLQVLEFGKNAVGKARGLLP